ncbi:MAG TPA: hypothetical protein VFM30_09415 [Steroidobacteraceae bacterium]|nr:hypothetical protein [Steroidobacteraceae bacterium]
MGRIATAAMLAAAAVAATATRADAPASGNGYEVHRSQTVVPVPHGKVGRKTIDRETRTGNTEDTDGNSSNFSLTVGGFMSRCPVPEGTGPVKFVVPGDFEVSVVADTVDTDAVPTARRHYEKRMTARITVFVNDDLSVTEGEIDGSFSSNMDGVRTGPVQVRKRYPIRAYGMPDWDALLDVTTATGDLAAAALMWNSSMTILEAMHSWREPNACAELVFDPPGETRPVGPGETVEIQVKYRTRDGQQPVPKGTWDASAVQGGSVAEASGQVRPDGTFVVRYKARSADPKDGDGARIEALSAAGYARDTWKIRVGGDYEVRFESSIVSRDPVQSVRSTAQGHVRLTSSTKPWRRKPDGKQYLLYEGNGTVQFNTAPGPERDACDPLISGSGSSPFQVLESWIQVTPPADGKPGKADVQLTYWFQQGAGETEMTPTNVDFQCVPGDTNEFPYWWSSYMSGREQSGDVNFLTDWEYVGQGDVVARKLLTGDCGGLCTEERSIFTLRKVTAGGR